MTRQSFHGHCMWIEPSHFKFKFKICVYTDNTDSLITSILFHLQGLEYDPLLIPESKQEFRRLGLISHFKRISNDHKFCGLYELCKLKTDVTAWHGIHLLHKKSMKYAGHKKLLCELSKFSKFNAFYSPRILNKQWCIYSCLQIPPAKYTQLQLTVLAL